MSPSPKEAAVPVQGAGLPCRHLSSWALTLQGWCSPTPHIGPAPSYLALLGVSQDLILVLGVEEKGLCQEGDGLPLEAGALIGAQKEALLSVTE